MNCPHPHRVFAAEPHSYRDLLLRLAEYGCCYRYEQSGLHFSPHPRKPQQAELRFGTDRDARSLTHWRFPIGHGENEAIPDALNQLVAVAEAMKIPCIWGEATAHSAPFYQRALGVEKILDHFFIEDEVMQHCRDELRRSREQMLARRSSK